MNKPSVNYKVSIERRNLSMQEVANKPSVNFIGSIERSNLSLKEEIFTRRVTNEDCSAQTESREFHEGESTMILSYCTAKPSKRYR